jgi:cysteine desulfurase
MSVAFEHNRRERLDTNKRLRRMRDRLKDAALGLSGVEMTGHQKERLPGHLSVIARDTDGASTVIALDLDGIAASTGAACTSGSHEVSHVLTAMGYPEDEARGSLRLTVGRTTTDDEVDAARAALPRVLERQRAGIAALAADPLGEGLRA